MQYAVPQFTDVEDKLIGPLTLKQFLIVLGIGGILFFFWSILGTGIIFYIIAAPIAGIGAYVTLRKFNGRPFFAYAIPLVNFLISSKVMVFKREAAIIRFSHKQIKKAEKTSTTDPSLLEPAESRLRKLAYLLDQKNEEEKELITHVASAIPAPLITPANKPTSRVNTVNYGGVDNESKVSKISKKFNPTDFLHG